MIRRTKFQLLSLEARDVPAALLLALPGLDEVDGLDVLADGTIQVVGQGLRTDLFERGAGLFQEYAPDGAVLRNVPLTGTATNLRPEEVKLKAVSGGRVVGEEFYHSPGLVAFVPTAWDSSTPGNLITLDSGPNVGSATDINRNGTLVGWSGGNDNFPTVRNTNSARVGTFGQPWATLDGPWSETTPNMESFAWGISDENTIVLSAHPATNFLSPFEQSWVYNLDTGLTALLPNPVATPDLDYVLATSISPNGRFVAGEASIYVVDADSNLYQLVLYSGPNWQNAQPLTLPDGRPFFSPTGFLDFDRPVVADDGMLFSDHYGDALAWVKAPGRPVMTLNDYARTVEQLDTDLVFKKVTDVVTRNGRHYLSVNTDRGGRVLVIDSIGGNRAPTVVDQAVAADEDLPMSLNLLTGAADADGDALRVTAVTPPAHGTITWAADGTATYRPDADYNGPDGFDVTVTDGTVSVVGRVNLTVRPVNDPPTVGADTARTPRGQGVTVNVLANDTDLDGDPLAVVGTTSPANGRVEVLPSRQLTYTPRAGFVGTDRFTYTVGDGQGGTATATVTVTIENVEETPAAPPGGVPPPNVPPPPGAVSRWLAVPGTANALSVIDATTGAEAYSATPFGAHGTAVAADFTGDGVPDLLAGAGPGAGPHVKLIDGATGAELFSFYAFGEGFLGGVTVAFADVNHDGALDFIVGAGPGAGPHVKVFDGRTSAELRSFFAYAEGFTGGVNVAGGDFDGDGFGDIITGAGPGAGPHVKVFSGRTGLELASFFAFDREFHGGVFVGAGDFDRDGRADIVTGAGPGAGPHVRVFVGTTLFAEALVGDPRAVRCVKVAGRDANGDGIIDLIATIQTQPQPEIFVFDSETIRDRRMETRRLR